MPVVNNKESGPPPEDRPRSFVTKKKAQGIEAELQTYLSTEREDEKYTPLMYWQTEGHKFPILSQMEHIFLAIPATSTPTEREFSTAGRTITDLRSSMKTTTLEAAVCLKSFDKFM